MKLDIEQRIIHSKPNTSSDNEAFITRTMKAIRAASAHETFERVTRTKSVTIKEQTTMKAKQSIFNNLRHQLTGRAGAFSLVGAVLIGGTAAAISLWPKPIVTQTTNKTLANGNHIVGYSAKNCNYFSQSNDPQKPTSNMVYYEVRKGSHLTDQQIKTSLRGVCEENQSDMEISALIKQLPQNNPGLMSTESYTITSITPGSITISPSLQGGTSTKQTFKNFAANLSVYNESVKSSLSDLATGDTIKMVARNTSGKSTETQENYNPMNHPEDVVILAIVKTPATTGDPRTIEKSFGIDMVRVNPCTSSPTGFCRAYDFQS